MCHEISVSIVLVSLFVGDLSFDMFSLVLLSMLLLICVLLGFFFFHWRHESCGFNVTLALLNLNPLQANFACILDSQ